MAEKKRRGNWVAYIFVIVGFILYKTMFVETGTTIQTPPSLPESSAPLPSAQQTYGGSGIRDDWPSLADSSASAGQNKLAKNYYVILDDSGSMQSNSCATGHDSRMGAAIEALAAFTEGLPPQANIGVMSFDNGQFTELLALGKRSSAEIQALSRRVRAGGDTPLATAITHGYEALRQQASGQVGYGEYHLVILTDGEASQGEYPDAIVKHIINESPVDIHTIGFCIGRDHVLNQPRYLSYQSADNVQALRQGLQDVLAEAPTFTVTRFE